MGTGLNCSGEPDTVRILAYLVGACAAGFVCKQISDIPGAGAEKGDIIHRLRYYSLCFAAATAAQGLV